MAFPPRSWAAAASSSSTSTPAARRQCRRERVGAGAGCPPALPASGPAERALQPRAAAAAAAPAGGQDAAPPGPPRARLPLGVLRLLLIVAVDAAGVLVVQLEALLAGCRLAVLRHHGGKAAGGGGKEGLPGRSL